jgi:hypothetical protein
VPAGQTSDIVVLLQEVDADGTGVAWVCEKLGRECSMDVLVIVIVLLVSFSVGALGRLHLLQTEMLGVGRRRLLLDS